MTLRRVTTATLASSIEKSMLGMEHGEAVAFARILAAEGMRFTRENEHAELAKFFQARLDGLSEDVVRSAVAKSLRGESIEAEELAWQALEAIAKADEFDPKQHPRDEGGRWAPKGNGKIKGGNNARSFRDNAGTPFVQQWERETGGQPGAEAFNRLNAGATLLQRTFGPALPPHAQIATQAAQYVGELGPYAAQVVVPTADKTAARYRGIERHEVDPDLEAALKRNASSIREDAAIANGEVDAHESYRAQVAANHARHERTVAEAKTREKLPRSKSPLPVPEYQDVTPEDLPRDERSRRNMVNQQRESILAINRDRTGAGGISRGQSKRVQAESATRLAAENTQARAKLLGDVTEARARSGAEQLRTMGVRRHHLVHGATDEETGKWNPGLVLGYWRDQLPSADMNTLHVKSGTVPPSRGMIMDATGKITSQAVGYGDDWYTPFSLNKLNTLKGGEYVRTRTFGGPTTEDIYTSLIHGARAMTVVSHSGSFTVEFDDSLTGGRRFNDKALRMTDRYAHLLDAVRSGQIKVGSMDPAMDAEIKAQADAVYPPSVDSRANAAEIRRLQSDLLANPRLSDSMQSDLSRKWLEDRAADRVRAKTEDASLQTAVSGALGRKVNSETEARVLQSQVAGFPVPEDERDLIADQVLGDERAKLSAGGSKDQLLAQADLLGWRPALDAYLREQAYETVQGSSPLVLNGRGYDTAMKALQEQFPYYIKSVQYHPWPDKVRGSRDTGYVRPGRNRPAAANVGFYGHDDPSGGFGGKLAADSTRWQERTTRTPGRQQEAPRAPAGTPEPPAPETATAAPERVQRVRRDANAAMFDFLRDQTQFGPEATYPGKGSIASAAAQPPPPEMEGLHASDREAFKAKLLAGDPAAEGELRRAAQFAREHKLFADLDGEVATKYWNGGLDAKAPAQGKEWHDFLDDKTFTNWPGPAFSGKTDPQTIQKVYANDEHIKPMLASGLLPPSADWTEDRGRTAMRLEKAIRGRDAEVNALAATGDAKYHREIEESDRQMKTQATALAKARTLAKSFDDSVAGIQNRTRADQELREAEAAAQPVGGFFDPETGDVRAMTPEEYFQFRGKLAANGKETIDL